jgi:putative two-component system hydrogenase maturation factor HypX/HoxX
LPPLPEDPVPPDAPARRGTWTDIRYEETGAVGHLMFSFPGGAMSTTHCTRLLDAYRTACSRPTSVLVLGGGRDFFSNGIHLGVIEAAADPAEESWANINAMNDLVQAVLTTTDRLVIAAMGGNAAAGGAMLALAADEVWCRKGSVLNPHYRLMGLSGSEYWTRTLPRRVGPEVAERLVHEALPLGAEASERLGLVDRTVACPPQDFPGEALRLAVRLSSSTDVQARIARKKPALERQEAIKPLAVHRQEELAAMRSIFFDPDAPYHSLRRAFVRKEALARTPHHLGNGVLGTRTADPSAGRDRNVTATAALAVAPGPADC